MTSYPSTRVALIGAGRGGTALLDLLHQIRTIEIVGITDRRILSTKDLVTWDRVARAPEAEPGADTPPFEWVTWDGRQFGATSISFAGCPAGVDECYQRWLLTSPDGLTWTESVGPDGVAGPDDSTWLSDLAGSGETSIVLGGASASPATVWVMEG